MSFTQKVSENQRKKSTAPKECECGSIVKNMAPHLKTKKHLKYVAEKEEKRIPEEKQKVEDSIARDVKEIISTNVPMLLSNDSAALVPEEAAQDKLPKEVAAFTVWRRKALKKVSANPKINTLEMAREMWPDKYLVKCDYIKDQACKAVVQFDSLKHFMDTIWTTKAEREANFYEIITGRLREAYDVEFLYETRPDLRGLTIDSLLEEFVARRNEFLDSVSEEWIGLGHVKVADLIVLDSSNAKKFSVHILVPDIYNWAFESPKQEAKWQRGLAAFMKEKSFFAIDASGVGRNDGLFRTIFSTKIGANRPLTVYQKGALTRREEYFVCTVLPKAGSVVNVEGERVTPKLSGEAEMIIEKNSDRVTDLLEKTFGKYFDVTQGKGNIWRLNRNGRTSICLIEKNHIHTDNHFAHVNRNGDVVVRCFQHEGTLVVAKDFLDIPFEAPEPETLKSATHFFEERISEEEYRAIVEEHDIVIDARNTGSGKTFSAIRYVEGVGGEFIVIHHRRSLDVDYQEKYKIDSYRRETSETKSCSVVINSLSKTILERFEGSIHNVNRVIIDEIRSVLRQLEMADIEQDCSMLLDFLQYHKNPIICIDANVRESDIEYIRSLRPGARIAVIVDASKEPLYSMEVAVVSCLGLQTTAVKILSEHKHTKLIVPYSCDVLKMEAVLKHTGRSYINIHKDTREESNLSAEELDKYEIIAHSPTISEGNSFDSPLFAARTSIGFFSSLSCGPETASQMTRRFRHVKLYKAFLAIRPEAPRFVDTESYYRYASSGLRSLQKLQKRWNITRTFEEKLGHSVLEIIKDDFWRLHAKNSVESELDQCNYFDVFVQRCVNNRFSVSLEILDIKKRIPVAEEARLYEIGDEVRHVYYEKMSGAPTIGSKQEYDAARTSAKTEEENLSLEKYYITTNAQISEPTPESLEYFGERKAILKGSSHLRDILKMKHTDSVVKGLVEKVIDRLDGKNIFIAQKSGVLNIEAVKADIMNTIAKSLGFECLLDLTEKSSLDEEGLKQLFTREFYFHTSKVFWKRPSSREYDSIAKKGFYKILHFINTNWLSYFCVNIIFDPQNLKWRHVCIAEKMDAAPNCKRGEGRGVLVPVDIDEKVGDMLNERFFVAEKRVVLEGGEKSIPLIKYYTLFLKEKKSCQEIKCKNCSKTYTRKSNLNKHEKECTGEEKKKKEYSCECCKKSFGNRKYDLERHQKICRPFPCPTCDMVFRKQNHLENHICFRARKTEAL